MIRPLQVLMISTDPRIRGGMTTMARMTMDYATETAFTFLPIGRVDPEGMFARMWRMLSVPITVVQAARGVDSVHLNTPFNVKGLLRDGLILLALRLVGHRATLLYFHGWQPHVAEAIYTSPLLRRLFLWLLRDVAHIMVLSQQFKDTLENIGIAPQRITVTRTMFDGRYLAEHCEAYATDERRRILFLSRLVREKGVYELLDAFARIANDYPDVDLVFAGDGPERERLHGIAAQRACAARIHFHGHVTGAEKASLLMGCHLFALPTYYPEGLPVALLEAMAAGKPVLTAKAGGIAEVLSQPENGIVLDAVTADTVEAALRQLLDDREYCRAVGAHNAAIAWERFEAHAVTGEIEQTYQRIAEGSPSLRAKRSNSTNRRIFRWIASLRSQ